MKNRVFLLLLCLPFLAGCAAKQERAATKKITAACERLIGHTEEDVVLQLGVPEKIQTIGDLKIYQYHKSYGERTEASGYMSGPTYYGHGFWGSGYGSGYEKSWEAYDKIEIFFKHGRVIKWNCSVKR